MDDKPYTYGPVEPEELMFALALGDAAATLKTPVENPGLKGVNLVDEQSGQLTRISFADRPLNRAMLAVREHFKDDKFMSVMLRLFALFEISKHKAVQEWVRETPKGEGIEIADALVYAAARASLSKKLKLNAREMVRLAKEFEKKQESRE